MTVNRLDTAQLPWSLLGIIDATAGAADSALGVTERRYDSLIALANGIGVSVAEGVNKIELRFKLPTDGDDALIDIWGARKADDDLIRVCTVTVKAGTQQVGATAGAVYADTLALTNNNWNAEVSSIVPAAEFMGRILFDVTGYAKIGLHGHTTVDADVTVEYSGY